MWQVQKRWVPVEKGSKQNCDLVKAGIGLWINLSYLPWLVRMNALSHIADWVNGTEMSTWDTATVSNTMALSTKCWVAYHFFSSHLNVSSHLERCIGSPDLSTPVLPIKLYSSPHSPFTNSALHISMCYILSIISFPTSFICLRLLQPDWLCPLGFPGLCVIREHY